MRRGFSAREHEKRNRYTYRLDEDVLLGAVRDISAADCLVVGGTSLVVYPAAGLLQYFQGDTLVSSTATPRRRTPVPTCSSRAILPQAFAF